MHFLSRFTKHAPRMPRHDYTFRECVNGTAPVPHDPFGNAVFQLLMAIFMTTVMVTFNGVLHHGPEFLITSHWMYPVILCISLGVRFLFANDLAAFLAPRVIPAHLGGFARNAAMATMNVIIMAPVMGCVVTLLMHGPDHFLEQLILTLPITAPVSLVVNLLVVGPIVRMICHNIILPNTGTRLFQITQHYVTNWAGVFTS